MIRFTLGRTGKLSVITTGATEAECRAKLEELEELAARAKDEKQRTSLETKADALRLVLKSKYGTEQKERGHLDPAGIEYR